MHEPVNNPNDPRVVNVPLSSVRLDALAALKHEPVLLVPFRLELCDLVERAQKRDAQTLRIHARADQLTEHGLFVAILDSYEHVCRDPHAAALLGRFDVDTIRYTPGYRVAGEPASVELKRFVNLADEARSREVETELVGVLSLNAMRDFVTDERTVSLSWGPHLGLRPDPSLADGILREL